MTVDNRRGPARVQKLWVAALVGVPLLAGTATGARAATCSAPPETQSQLDAEKQGWLAYGCSGDYGRDLASVAAQARAYVERRAGEVTKPALVLDIDETSLANWPQMLANDFRHIPTGPCRIAAGGTCSERAWDLRAGATAIRPTLELFDAARARGVAVFFLTGRNDDPALRAATARNLRRAGYRGWTALIMRGPDERNGMSAYAYKSRRRAGIEAQGYTIIATVGDQWSDLDGGSAERKFKLPNPFYFIP